MSPKPKLDWPTYIPADSAELPSPKVKGAWKPEVIFAEFNNDPNRMAEMIGSLRRYAKELEGEVTKLRTLNQKLLDDSGANTDDATLKGRLDAMMKEAYAMQADDIVVEPRVLVSMLQRVVSGEDSL